MDKSDNIYVKDFLALLDTFSLTQHVQGPTHSHGHTLDLIITKGLSVSVTIKDLALSDHFCLFSDISMSPCIQSSCIMTGRRIINENTAALFEQALIQTPDFPTSGVSVNDLLELFNTKMESIMNDVAPLKLKSITSK